MASRVSDEVLENYLAGRFALVRRFAIAQDLRDLRRAARAFLQEEDLCQYDNRYWDAMKALREAVNGSKEAD